MKLLFIDFETGGLDPEVHSPLSLGFILYDSSTDKEIASSYIQLKHDTYIVTAEALNINNLSIQRVHRAGITLQELVNLLENMAKQHGEKIIIAGWNVKFDLDFMKTIFKHTGQLQKFNEIFYYKPLDVCSMNFLVTGKMTNLEDAAKNLGISVGKNDFHNAYYDVAVTLKIYRKLKALINQEV